MFEVVWKPERGRPICAVETDEEASAVELFATLAADVRLRCCLWVELWQGERLEDHREQECGTCRALAGARAMVEAAFAEAG